MEEWNKPLHFQSVSFLQNALCVELFSPYHDLVFHIVNVYGSCVTRE